jgi:hypothetical protein
VRVVKNHLQAHPAGACLCKSKLIVSLPTTTGTWYPQVTYKTLHNNSPYATVYGKVTF